MMWEHVEGQLVSRSTVAQRTSDLLDLPVDHRGQSQEQTADRSSLPLEVLLVEASAPAVVDGSCEGVELFSFEKASSNPRSMRRPAQIVKDELGLEDSAKFAPFALATVLGPLSHEALQRDRGRSVSALE